MHCDWNFLETTVWLILKKNQMKVAQKGRTDLPIKYTISQNRTQGQWPAPALDQLVSLRSSNPEFNSAKLLTCNGESTGRIFHDSLLGSLAVIASAQSHRLDSLRVFYKTNPSGGWPVIGPGSFR